MVLSPVILAFEAVNHVKVVPETLLVNETLDVDPEQIVCELGFAVAIGIELTVIGTVIAVPAQPDEVGVTV